MTISCLLFFTLLTQTPAPGSTLEQQLFALVAQNRWAEAVARSASALKNAPGDPTVRALAIDLHMSLARRMFAQERFPEAEAAAQAVLALDPARTPAKRIVDSIAQARLELPTRLEQAGKYLKLERYESAAAIYRQADALDPAGQSARAALRWQALLGASDQHYLCGNFPDAFLRYEGILRLFPDGPAKNDPDVQERRLVSLILAIGQSKSTAPGNWGQWEQLLQQAVEALKARPDQQLLSVLAGLGWEAVGNRSKAIGCFSDALTRPLPVGGELAEAGYQELRSAALAAVKQRAETGSIQHRGGAWAASAGSDWQILPVSERIFVKHFNHYAARRMAEALHEELIRLPAILGLSAREALGDIPLTIWIHPEDRPFPGPPAEPLGKGRTALALTNGKLTHIDIHLHQTDPLSLSSSLPHELAHVLLAVALGPKQLPLAIEEGLVVQAEPPARQVMLARMYRESMPLLPVGEGGVRVAAASQPAGWLSRLLTCKTYPAESSGVFYAQSATLVAYLQAKKTPAGVIQFARQTAPQDWPSALPAWLGLPDLAAVEKAVGR